MTAFENALEQLRKVKQYLDENISSNTHLLEKPMRVLQANLRVRMDDGSIKEFEGFRVVKFPIKDCYIDIINCIEERIPKIEEKIKKLINNLENKKV